MVNVPPASAPMWNSGFLLAHEANSVIAEKEDQTGSHIHGARLALRGSPQAAQAISPTSALPFWLPMV